VMCWWIVKGKVRAGSAVEGEIKLKCCVGGVGRKAPLSGSTWLGQGESIGED
jgi:hypothetical protein